MSKITNELIVKAKAKHGVVYVLEASGEASTTIGELADSETPEPEKIETATGEFVAEKGKVYAIIHKPDRRTIGFSMTHKDPIQMGNAILKNTIVEIDGESYADPEILESEDINIAAALQVTTLINIGTARLKKY